MAALFFFFITFWSVPVVFLTSLANLDALVKLPAFTWIPQTISTSQYNTINGFMTGTLPAWLLALVSGGAIYPTIELLVYLLLNYNIFRNRNYSQNALVKHSDAESKYTLNLYYIFLLFNVLFVSTIGGTITNVLHKLVSNPSLREIVTLLSASLPSQSVFFLNYLLALTFGRVTLELLRFGELFLVLSDFLFRYSGIWLILEQCLCCCRRKYLLTPSEKNEIRKCDVFEYGRRVAQDLLIFTIAITYSTMAPLILPLGLLYFAFKYVVSKYNFINAFARKYESGGEVFDYIWGKILIGLLIFQLTMLGVFGINISLSFLLRLGDCVAGDADCDIGFVCVYVFKVAVCTGVWNRRRRA
eukprot:TRINITY_DN3029_c0_g2_i1.p1 TRINITY_DN3029_c0_g2~~TRINITY_DN3029_c0_g2_i1.p1  ORF type:complete len:377 (-),score=47.62 TRINITY_DN3029_c0_g2_i1:625-1698(-)